MKPSMTNFNTQGYEQRGSIRPLRNNYVRMKFILFTLLLAGASLLSMANGGNGKATGSGSVTGSGSAGIGSFGSGNRADGGGTRDNTSASTAEIEYIAGKVGEYLFHVVYNNVTGSHFSLTVLDAEGNQLFQSHYSDKKFDKKFRLADPEDFSKVTFVIRNFGDNSVQRWEVDAHNKVVEDVEVKEVQ